MTYPPAGSGSMTLTIDESRDGLFSLGFWSATFSDQRYNDRGSLQVAVEGQKPDSVGIILSTSRVCQGVFGSSTVGLVATVTVAGDRMAGTFEEIGCTLPVVSGSLTLSRR
jgi:hypothetical protein